MKQYAINKRAQTYSDKVGTYFHLDGHDRTCSTELICQKLMQYARKFYIEKQFWPQRSLEVQKY